MPFETQEESGESNGSAARYYRFVNTGLRSQMKPLKDDHRGAITDGENNIKE